MSIFKPHPASLVGLIDMVAAHEHALALWGFLEITHQQLYGNASALSPALQAIVEASRQEVREARMRSGSFTDRGRRGEPVFREAALDRYQGRDIPSVAGNEPLPMRQEDAAGLSEPGLSERSVQPPFPTPIAACLPSCCDRRCDRTRGSEALDTLLAYELRYAGDRPPGFYFEVS